MVELRLAAAVAVAVAALPGAAAADTGATIAIVKGGSGSARSELTRSLGAVRSDLAVCLRGGRVPRSIRVELSVGADGRVGKSRAVTAGAAAQCVAGILAVSALAGTGTSHLLVVDVATGGKAPAGGSGDLEAALAGYGDSFRACHDRSERAGRVVMKFLVKPDGRILDPEVTSSTLGDAAVERCLVDAFAAIRLPARAGASTMSMSYQLDLGKPGKSTASDAPAGDPSLMPKKTGPLSGDAIGRVMNANRAKFSACYDRVARKQRGLAGRVLLRFTIRGDGTVRNVQIKETTLGSPAVEACIVSVGKQLTFPAETGRDVTKVWYPFAFSQ